MTRSLPVHPSLESDRKRAKALLKRWRAGDPEALARAREHHPLLRRRETAAHQPTLSDAQLVVAREYGLASWPRLKHLIEALTASFDERLELLVDSACGGDHRRAKALLESDPALATASLATACVVGDARTALAMVAADPALAKQKLPPKGWEPIVYVCLSQWRGHEPEIASARAAIVAALLERGADPNAYALEDAGGRLPTLYGAVGRNDYAAAAELLLKAGADPNDGESLYHAAERAHTSCLELLLAHGADVDGRQNAYARPLTFLLGYKQLHANRETADEGVRWLLERGADPNLPSGPTAETALHRAASSGRDGAMAELLIAHGADPEPRTTEGHTAYELAVLAGNGALVEWFEQRGDSGERAHTPAEALISACVRGDAQAARSVLAAGAPPVAELDTEQRAVIAATGWCGSTRALRLMLELGFPVDATGPSGETPLHAAAWTGQRDKVELLLGKKPPLELRCLEFGSTPLGWACHGSRNCRNPRGDYAGLVELLLAAGADESGVMNKWEENLFSIASEEVADVILAHGATDRGRGAK